MNTETKTMTLSAIKQKENYAIGMNDLQGFELAQRAAKLLSSSTLVPKEYQGHLSNCVIALNMAQRVGADPLMVMQNLIIVHGRPTWSSQFLISTVNTSGRFTALRYEFFGEKDTDSWGCRAWAIEKATDERLVGTDITIKLAKDEGWYGKNGSKWKTMPQQMLMYRAGSWWTRAYAPELSMGLHTADEVQDIIDIYPDGSYTFEKETFTVDELKKPAQQAEVVEEVKEESTKKNKQSDLPIAGTVDAESGVVSMTFAQVNDMLIKAKSADEIDTAASFISSVPDQQHQEELKEVYESLKKSKE